MTCKKTQGFLESVGGEVKAKEEAAKIKYSAEQALKLLEGIHRFVAIKGKRVVTFDLKNERPEDDVLLSHLIGPTGNLRAPTARVGNTLVVGFNEEAYQEVLGK